MYSVVPTIFCHSGRCYIVNENLVSDSARTGWLIRKPAGCICKVRRDGHGASKCYLWRKASYPDEFC